MILFVHFIGVLLVLVNANVEGLDTLAPALTLDPTMEALHDVVYLRIGYGTSGNLTVSRFGQQVGFTGGVMSNLLTLPNRSQSWGWTDVSPQTSHYLSMVSPTATPTVPVVLSVLSSPASPSVTESLSIAPMAKTSSVSLTATPSASITSETATVVPPTPTPTPTSTPVPAATPVPTPTPTSAPTVAKPAPAPQQTPPPLPAPTPSLTMPVAEAIDVTVNSPTVPPKQDECGRSTSRQGPTPSPVHEEGVWERAATFILTAVTHPAPLFPLFVKPAVVDTVLGLLHSVVEITPAIKVGVGVSVSIFLTRWFARPKVRLIIKRVLLALLFLLVVAVGWLIWMMPTADASDPDAYDAFWDRLLSPWHNVQLWVKQVEVDSLEADARWALHPSEGPFKCPGTKASAGHHVSAKSTELTQVISHFKEKSDPTVLHLRAGRAESGRTTMIQQAICSDRVWLRGTVFLSLGDARVNPASTAGSSRPGDGSFTFEMLNAAWDTAFARFHRKGSLDVVPKSIQGEERLRHNFETLTKTLKHLKIQRLIFDDIHHLQQMTQQDAMKALRIIWRCSMVLRSSEHRTQVVFSSHEGPFDAALQQVSVGVPVKLIALQPRAVSDCATAITDVALRGEILARTGTEPHTCLFFDRSGKSADPLQVEKTLVRAATRWLRDLPGGCQAITTTPNAERRLLDDISHPSLQGLLLTKEDEDEDVFSVFPFFRHPSIIQFCERQLGGTHPVRVHSMVTEDEGLRAENAALKNEVSQLEKVNHDLALKLEVKGRVEEPCVSYAPEYS